MLHELVDAGNTVVVIEHNLEVIKTADWIIDMGPEGGDGGGRIVAGARRRTWRKVKESYTGQYLRELLGRRAGGAQEKQREGQTAGRRINTFPSGAKQSSLNCVIQRQYWNP